MPSVQNVVQSPVRDVIGGSTGAVSVSDGGGARVAVAVAVGWVVDVVHI